MSPFDLFRGGGRQKGTLSPFFTVFFSGERPLDGIIRMENLLQKHQYDAAWYFLIVKIQDTKDPAEGGGEGAASGPFWQGLPSLDAGQDPRGRHEGHHLEEDGEHQEVAVLPRSVKRKQKIIG